MESKIGNARYLTFALKWEADSLNALPEQLPAMEIDFRFVSKTCFPRRLVHCIEANRLNTPNSLS